MAEIVFAVIDLSTKQVLASYPTLNAATDDAGKRPVGTVAIAHGPAEHFRAEYGNGSA